MALAVSTGEIDDITDIFSDTEIILLSHLFEEISFKLRNT